MRHRAWIGIGFSLSLALVAWAPDAAAQSRHTVLVGNSSTLTIDVLPLEAEVLLNGVQIGSAHDLVARPVLVIPGRHIVTVAAKGYLPATLTVLGKEDWTTRVWLKLVPDRGR